MLVRLIKTLIGLYEKIFSECGRVTWKAFEFASDVQSYNCEIIKQPMIDEATELKELLQNVEENKLWQESITMMNTSAFFPFVVDKVQRFVL